MLRVRVLGELALERDGEAVPAPPGRRLNALLGWLALHPGPQPRIEVAGSLWPDVLDESARASLRSALGELRRVLRDDPGWILATRDTVGLGSEVWVDLHAFEGLVRAGRIGDAMDLVRGELLHGLAEEWVYEHRERQREREGELLGRLAAEHERADDLEAAIACMRRRLERDPLSESAARDLMRLLAAGGDRPAALAAYSRLAERLRRELGMAPAAETRRLAEELRRAAPADAAPLPVPPLPPALSRSHRSPFVGRAGALARLRRVWDAARAGERRVAMLAGDAGIGKTRLVGELARIAHGWGGTVLYGRSHADAIAPYQPFADALRPFIAAFAPEELRALGGPLVGELSRLVPDRADCLPPLEAAPAGDPGGARYRLFEACSSLLTGAARSRPAVLVLEDLHWADASSLALLRHLARAGPAPLLVVATYRQSDLGSDHPLGDVLAALRREEGFEGIALDGLPAEDLGVLTAAWLGADAPDELSRALADETGGNPFFAEELLRELAERRRQGEPHGWPSPAGVGVPERVREIIGQRLRLLGERTRQTLLVAAVAGRALDLDLLAKAAECSPEALVDDLDDALGAHLLREEPGRPRRYAFRHALIREAIYEQLSAGRRALLHERVARAIERLGAGELEHQLGQLAHHYLLAGEAPALRQKAVEYAERAGRSAGSRLAYEEAARHYELALEALADARGGAVRRAELTCALGEARLRAAGLEAARETFDAAAMAAREADAPELLARAALGRSGLGVIVLAPDAGTVALLEEALAALGPRPADEAERALRARMLARLAVELYHVSEPRREELSAEAVDVARDAGAPAALADSLGARHVALWSPPHLAERLAIANEIVELAETEGDGERGLQGHNWLVTDLCELGDFAGVRRAIDEHARRADDLRLPTYQWWVPAWRAMLAIADGRFADAERFAAEAREIGQRTSDPTEALFGWYQSLYIRSEREPPSGELPDYVPERVAVRAVQTAFRPALPAIYAEAGREDDARAELQELASEGFGAVPRDFNWLSSVALLARGAALLADAPTAAELYERLLPYRERAILVGRAGLCHGPAELYLGLLASSCSRWDAAERHHQAALRWAEGAETGLFAAWARTYWSETLLARGAPGDAERARALAGQALAFAEERGLGRIAERGHRVLAVAGGGAAPALRR